MAQRGQYVLTRREILKYITSEASTRAQEIQELLNIIEVENIRKALVKVQNDLEKELKSARHFLITAQAAVNSTIQEKTFQKEIVLTFVNQNRSFLGGEPISTLHSTELKVGLKPPSVVHSDQSVNVTLLDRDIQNVMNLTLTHNKAQIAISDKELRDLITIIKSDPKLAHALSRFELIRLGIRLIDETGNCPLCDYPWPPGELVGDVWRDNYLTRK